MILLTYEERKRGLALSLPPYYILSVALEVETVFTILLLGYSYSFYLLFYTLSSRFLLRISLYFYRFLLFFPPLFYILFGLYAVYFYLLFVKVRLIYKDKFKKDFTPYLYSLSLLVVSKEITV